MRWIHSLLCISLLSLLSKAVLCQPIMIPTGGSSLPHFVSKVIPDRQGSLFAVTGNGLYQSIDDGLTWKLRNRHTQALTDIYQASDGLYTLDRYSGRLERSIDQGRTFSLVSQFTSHRPTSILLVEDTLMLLWHSSGLLKSTDRGGTWKYAETIDKYSSHGRLLVRTSKTGTEISSNVGSTWKLIPNSKGEITFGVRGRIHIFDTQKIQTTTNDGQTLAVNTLPSEVAHSDRERAFVVADSIGAIYYHPRASTNYSRVIFRSMDNGASWRRIDLPFLGSVIGILGSRAPLISSPDLFTIVADTLVPWSASVKSVVDISESGGDRRIVATTFGLATANSDLSRVVQSNYSPSYSREVIAQVELSDRILASIRTSDPGVPHGLWVSSDHGGSWELSAAISTEYYIKQFVIVDGFVLAGTSEEGILRSTNKGDSWQPSNSGFFSSEVRSMARTVGSAVLAATNDGLYLSSDAGSTWSRKEVLAHSPAVNCIALTREGTIMVGTDEGLYISQDFISWRRVFTGMDRFAVTHLAVDSAGGVYVGSDRPVSASERLMRFKVFYLSHIDGQATEIAFETDTLQLTSLLVDRSGFVYLGTSEGLYGSERSTISSGAVHSTSHTSKPKLSLQYGALRILNSGEEVSLSIYDVIGRNLFDGRGPKAIVESELNQRLMQLPDWIGYRLSEYTGSFMGAVVLR
jgi:photosystem II stability/assembly factor-like uncharacterized protein